MRSLRESMEITQAELAERTGMLAAQLCRIETGRTDPSIGTALRIAEALGVAPAELLSAKEFAAPEPAPRVVLPPRDEPDEAALLVREVPRTVERAARRAIAKREPRYDRLLPCAGQGTMLPLTHPFIREPDGAETLSRVMRAALGAGEATLADLPGMLDLNGVRIHFVSFCGGESSVSFLDTFRNILSIAVKKADTPERQTYRLAYELGAACLFASTGCRTLRDKDFNHRFLRRFAAAFLMPEDAVRKVVSQCGLTRKSWTLDALLALKVRFNVSAEAFALRLWELRLMPPSLRNRFRDELRSYYAAHPKAMEPAPRLPRLRGSVRMQVFSALKPRGKTKA